MKRLYTTLISLRNYLHEYGVYACGLVPWYELRVVLEIHKMDSILVGLQGKLEDIWNVWKLVELFFLVMFWRWKTVGCAPPIQFPCLSGLLLSLIMFCSWNLYSGTSSDNFFSLEWNSLVLFGCWEESYLSCLDSSIISILSVCNENSLSLVCAPATKHQFFIQYDSRIASQGL